MSSGVEDQLKALYDEQKQLTNELKVLREQERELSREATLRRSKRDKIKHERQPLLSQARKARELRDEINAQIAEIKKLRDETVGHSRQLRQKIALTAPGRKDSSGFDLFSVVELKYKIYDLEYRFQTSTHTPKEEKELVDQIADIEDIVEKRIAEGKLDGIEAPSPSEDIIVMIDELKGKAQNSHEEMLLLVERGQKEHAKVNQMFDEVSRLQDEENRLHEEFVEILNTLEDTRTRIENHQKRLDILKDEVVDLRIQRAEMKKKVRIDAIQERLSFLMAKKKSGESLTPEEMEYLMAQGESPF